MIQNNNGDGNRFRILCGCQCGFVHGRGFRHEYGCGYSKRERHRNARRRRRNGSGLSSSSSLPMVATNVVLAVMDCVVCKNPAKEVCSSCKNVSYCSVTCQKSDWKVHKKSCSPFIIKKKEDGTEYFEATRDIKVGTIIFDETPIFQLPFNENNIVCCLSCSIPLRGEKIKKYGACGWPVCSTQCAQLSIHRDNECKFFSSNKIKYSPELGMDFPLIAAGIRAFQIKKNDSKLWEYLQNLGLDNMKKEKFHPNHFGKSIMLRLRKSKEKKELEEALKSGYKLFFLLCCNGFARLLIEYAVVTPDPETGKYINPNMPRYRGTYLFLKAGKMTHSCSPNTIWYVSDFPDFKIRIRAIASIKQGEELTLSRIAHRPEETRGTIERREHLKKYCGIECKCPRCSSPSEFDSYNSALRCYFCTDQHSSKRTSTSGDENRNSGYFLPVDPLIFDKSGQNILFKCNRCSKEIPYSEFLPKLNEISQQLDQNPRFDPDFPPFSVSYVQNFIDKWEEFLHPNHYLLQRAHYSVVEFLRNHIQDLTSRVQPRQNPFPLQIFSSSASEISDGLHRCYFMEETVQKIMPGLSYAKARILANSSTFKMHHVKLISSVVSTTEVFEDLKEQIREIIQELDLLLAFYKDDLPSHQDCQNCDQFVWFKSQRDYLQHQLENMKLVPLSSAETQVEEKVSKPDV